MNRVVFTRATLLAAAAALTCTGTSLSQVTVFSNGFEADTAGWDASTLPTRVPSGTSGITSAAGAFHATAAGAATRWGAYRTVFPAQGYTTSVAVYLDLAGGAANDTRFDFTSAINNSAGSHRRDFAFNAGFYNDSDITGSGPRFVISASNGAGRSAAFPKNPGRAPYAVTASGWYTLEHVFSNSSGQLNTQLNLKNAAGTTLSSWTLNDPSDTIAAVGGNRYGWFASNEFSSLAIDSSAITMPVPPPVYNVTDNLYFETLTGALAAATTDAGDQIQLAAGTYTEAAVNINKAVTIKGPNAGISGTGSRVAEARISNTALTVNTAGVVIDGVEIYQTNTTSDAVLLQAASTVQNSVIKRESPTAGNFCRGITTAVGVTGISISGNLFTGDSSGSFFSGHKTWQSGIYSNGGGATISGNTFENCRAALNLDDFNSGIVISGNSFRSCGTYASFGGVTPTGGAHTITGNDFDINFADSGSLPSAFFNNSNVDSTFRLDATGNTFDGVATTALTNAQKFALEARMTHRGRGGKNGVVDYVAGQQIVVAGTTIGSAINAAAVSDTVLVGPGTFSEDVALNKAVTLKGTGAGSTTLSGPIGGSDGATVRISASGAVVDGFTITRAGNNTTDWNNSNLNSAGLAIQGQAVTGTVISNNLITGNRSAIDINNSNGHTLRNNVITNNHTGVIFRNQTDSITFVENAVTANRTVGVLFLDASGGSNSPVQTAATSTFSNNSISGNWYGQVVDRQSGGSLPAPGSNIKNFEGNWYGSATPTVTTANSAEPGYAALIPASFGGSATAPPSAPDIAGPASANIDYKPYLSLGTDTDVETVLGRGTYGFQGNQASLWDGTTISTTISGSQTYTDLFVPTGTTITVSSTGSLAVTGKLELAPGATIVVNGGALLIGQDSKISGTFTVFNSFGSWNINGDTTFEIGQSLALVTDIHIAAGKVVTVNGGGELILDGCIIDSQTPGSPYTITTAANGLLTMARCVVSDAIIDINTSNGSVAANLKSKVYDNTFTASDIEASADAKVYHNLFDGATNTAANSDATAAFANVDGWGNVTSTAGLKNKFGLEFVAPVAVGRTLDSGGNLYVQPGDTVVMSMGVASLDPAGITAAEALLGYNSDLLDPVGATGVVPAANWDVVVESAPTPTGSLGLIDSALGLEFTYPSPSVTADSNIANASFTALAPGLTVGFFRVQTDRVFDGNGQLVKDTRLTNFQAPSTFTLYSPYTSNTGEVVIDNQVPTINTLTSGTQVQPTVGSVNVLIPTPNYVIRDGVTPVILTFTADDNGLAGLDLGSGPGGYNSDLTLTATGPSTTLNSSNYTVVASGDENGLVTYTVTLNVPVSAGTGVYTVAATLRDRSGNLTPSPVTIGSFQIANEVLATVELQSFVGTGPGTLRNVTFVATGGTLKTWIKPVAFTAGTGTVALEDVPAGTTAISAKTAWTLRNKLTVPFSPSGVGSVAFTGSELLKAGDITGDNVINTLDYSVLRFNWLTVSPVADITGDGPVNSGDYTPLQANFFTVGDPQ